MKLKSSVTYLYASLVVVYALVLFLIPPNAAQLHKYHISLLQLRLADIAVLVPYALIWLAGFYGFAKLKAYGSRIRRAKDGRAVNLIANGLLLLVLWPPITAIVSTVFNGVVNEAPGFSGAATAINDYLSLLLPFVGFIIIGLGSRKLIGLTKLRPSWHATNAIVIITLALGLVFGHLLAHAFHQAPHFPLPYWVVFATLAGPYIYMWYVGLLAAWEVYVYHRKSAGIVYRRSWRQLSFGITGIIVMQIIVQYVSTLSIALGKLTFGWLVLVVYVVLILLAVGYILVAGGANDLQKIEEV